MSDVEGFADVGNRLEDSVGEVDLHLHVLHVGQLQAEQLVLRGELQLGVSLDPILVQRPVRFEEPRLLLFPPERVVRPVLLHIELLDEAQHDSPDVDLPGDPQGDVAAQVGDMDAQLPRPVGVAAVRHADPVQRHGPGLLRADSSAQRRHGTARHGSEPRGPP